MRRAGTCSLGRLWSYQHKWFLRTRWMNILRMTQTKLILALDLRDRGIVCNPLNLITELRDRTLTAHRPNRKEKMNLFSSTGEAYHFLAHIRVVPCTNQK